MRKLIVIFALVAAAVGQSGHSVTLNWTASPTPSVTYNVYRATAAAGPFSQINPSPVNAVSFLDSAVTAGTTYYYYVRAFDGTTESSNSNQVNAVVPSAPAPPTNLTVTVK